jgi:hypothetical protein
MRGTLEVFVESKLRAAHFGQGLAAGRTSDAIEHSKISGEQHSSRNFHDIYQALYRLET